MPHLHTIFLRSSLLKSILFPDLSPSWRFPALIFSLPLISQHMILRHLIFSLILQLLTHRPDDRKAGEISGLQDFNIISPESFQ